MDGLDGSDLEDNSEDDFEGYLDMDRNDIEEERDEREVFVYTTCMHCTCTQCKT